MNNNELLAYFNEVFSDLEGTTSLFSDDSFNKVPFKDSWTAGQVVQHLKLANQNFAQVLTGEVADTDRPMDQKVAVLRDIFLNFETKLNSPDFIKPAMEAYDKAQHLASIKQIKHDIAAVIPSLDLSKTCLDFELPQMGHLTRLESVYFVIFHTTRHVHQLKNIFQYLKLA